MQSRHPGPTRPALRSQRQHSRQGRSPSPVPPDRARPHRSALDGVTWVRTDPTGTEATEGNIAAPGFTGTSPAFLVATARLLRLAPGVPATRVRLLALTDPVLAPRTVDQAWALAARQEHPTDSGPLLVDEYRVTALDTGEVHTVHIAGDVVLSAPGVELEHLETPPSAFEDS
ncbi:hypothetical protein ACFCYM_35205 [Streptomyces sp. NPDC056254]|uniref:hypothetical protein n=1 Tax=Streptomyces sp. NPDC056254 TaxID=3345763 RepID=UPI0035D876EC